MANDLSQLSACILASWRMVNFEETGFGGLVRITYELSIHVNISYGTQLVYQYTANIPERFIAAVPKAQSGTFDPETDPRSKNPYPLLAGDKKLWSKISTFQRRLGIVNPALRTATVAPSCRPGWPSARSTTRSPRLAQAGQVIPVVFPICAWYVAPTWVRTESDLPFSVYTL